MWSAEQENIFTVCESSTSNIGVQACAGCLTGDTIISTNRAGKGKKITIKHLFEMFNGGKKSGKYWNLDIPTKVRSLFYDNNIIQLNEIVDVYESGIKNIWLLKLENGFELRATEDHRIMTNNGWKILKDLTIDDLVLFDDLTKHQTKIIKNDKTISKKRNTDHEPLIGEYYNNKRKCGRYYRGREQYLVYESVMNNMSLDAFKTVTYSKELSENLFFIDKSKYILHHIDFNHQNNDISNLIILSKEEHNKLHSKNSYINFGHGYLKYSKVVLVEDLGMKEMTYDIECKQPNDNFVANGIVVHNSGKTTTMIEVAGRLSKTGKKVVIVAFNKRIAEELNNKCAKKGIDVKSGTQHSFGFAAIRKLNAKIKVDNFKVAKIFDSISNKDVEKYKWFVVKLVNYAKDRGIGYQFDINDHTAWEWIIDHYDLSIENGIANHSVAIELAIKCLQENNKITHTCDFADMIYLPLIHKCKPEQFDVVIIDEAQDTNFIRRQLCKQMGKQIIFVGDKKQAIFGFCGADNNSLDILSTELNADIYTLSNSYRCPKAVVNYVNEIVEDANIHSAGDIDGNVREIDYSDLTKETLSKTDGIICRYNAPLLHLAFFLIRNGVACRIEGRDIAQQIINLLKRWKAKSLHVLIDRLEEYKQRELLKAEEKGSSSKADLIKDRCECATALINRAIELNLDIDGLYSMINSMFGDSETDKRQLLTLSSVHKAKGLEWDNVYLLGRKQFMPSPKAKKEWELQQETNLIYVALTRAKQQLIEVNNVPKNK